MGPDFARYDATQLQQILKTIDAARFPERVAEIRARLAAMAEAGQLAPASGATTSSVELTPELRILRRVGAVMMAFGALAGLQTIYVFATSGALTFDMTMLMLIAGIFLWQGSLPASSIVRCLACAGLPLLLLTPIEFFMVKPFDLIVAQFRLYPYPSLASAAVTLTGIALNVWLFVELGRAPVLAARDAAGRPRRDMRIPLTLGVVGCLIIAVLAAYLFGGGHARRAEEIARSRCGDGYRYSVTTVLFRSDEGTKTFKANVEAWNDKEIIAVPVTWKE